MIFRGYFYILLDGYYSKMHIKTFFLILFDKMIILKEISFFSKLIKSNYVYFVIITGN